MNYYEHEKIGIAIRKLRKQKGYSQLQLSRNICHRTTITHLENGRFKAPSIILLSKVCKKLEIKLDDFFEYVNKIECFDIGD